MGNGLNIQPGITIIFNWTPRITRKRLTQYLVTANRTNARVQTEGFKMRVFRLSALILAIAGVAAPVLVKAATNDGVCAYPEGLQQTIVAQYPGRKVVGIEDLSESDRELFTKDHGNTCPGLIAANFYGDGNPTYFLSLIAAEPSQSKAYLVAAHKVGASWKLQLVDSAKSSVPVVWSQDPGTYTDVDKKHTLHAKNPVIVFCGYEAWAILYAWTGKRIEKIWLLD